jgi:RND superfamily putative drug exporter
MGPALALSIAITLLAALTVAPALMSILGRYLFWPFGNRIDFGRPSVWTRLARITTTYPVIVTIVVVVRLRARSTHSYQD